MSNFGQILTAMVTPFEADGAVDLEAAKKLMHFLVDHGSDGIVVAGTTGESPTLDDTEKLALFELAVAEVGGRATVIAGTGSNDTAHSVALTRKAGELGVDGVLVVTPYYNKPPRAGILGHFTAVAAATDKPVMLYNIPGRCVINLEPDLLAELGEVDNIVAVKQANDDLDQARAILSDSGLQLYAGDDNLLCRFMELGGSGGVCVSSHFVGPQMKEVCELVASGEVEQAREVDASLHDVYETLFITSGTITTKVGLNLMGIGVGDTRLPLVDATPEETERVRTMLEHHNLLATV